MLGPQQQKSPFDRIDWLASLHAHCLADHAPLLVEARNGRGSSFLPLMRPQHGVMRSARWQALANWYSFTAAPIFAGSDDQQAKLEQLGALARALPARSWRINLAPAADDDGHAALLCDAFAAAGWIVSRTTCDWNHITRLSGESFDGWWQKKPGQLRSTIRRKGNKNAVAIRINPWFSVDDWSDYERVYATSWKPSEGAPDFLKALAEAEGSAGRLRIGLAYLDGKPVAAQFWTVDHGTAYIHKLAHDPKAQEFSPGSLLSAAMFQHVIDIDRVHTIDFGTGDDNYKRDWMDQVRPRYRIELLWPHHPASWPFIARNWLRNRQNQL